MPPSDVKRMIALELVRAYQKVTRATAVARHHRKHSVHRLEVGKHHERALLDWNLTGHEEDQMRVGTSTPEGQHRGQCRLRPGRMEERGDSRPRQLG
eukprot:2355990-Rhodomonas_salina.1